MFSKYWGRYMKKAFVLFFFISLTSASLLASRDSLKCYPELAGGDEVIEVVLSFSKTASMFVGPKPVEAVQGASFTENGNIYDYGKAILTIHASDGKKVTLSRNYDELVLDISALDLGMSDERYMCN